MEQQTDEKVKGVWRSLDWWIILIYVALLAFGWISICGASYDFDMGGNIFSFEARSGMQIVWIGTSLMMGFLLLMLDGKVYDTLAYVIYLLLLVLLFITPFFARDIKGSHSWIKIGPFSLQSAEFAKCATSLALAKFMSVYGYNISRWKDFLMTLTIIIVPIVLIILQRETGSALVYLAFFLMLYREGMTGSVLFAGVSAVTYFVVGVRYENTMLGIIPTSVGEFLVLTMVLLFTAGMVYVYCKRKDMMRDILLYGVGTVLLSLCFSGFVIPFDIKWILLAVCVAVILYLCREALKERVVYYFYIAMFALGSLVFFYSADYVLNSVMEPHQRVRINVLLGLEDDLAGAGYNVNQAKIAIGSGGLSGKGFLNGTQTKLKYVPEQDTDFIFCTVGEEEGFWGAAGVLMLFLFLILRLIHLAERQSTDFGRIYGYCVMSIFLFHVFINVGMVLGLTPVIGIPLPFFSYGGSSLWGFTILLFIFLRIDAGRNLAKHS
ncbi:rod shape-determining protein RodA [Phocaeicola sartorii]|uniref:rod shape-determining protein RodA n=1 Tax=Phocaeicola sartorii TaxID=671267 RepID=UPI00258ADED3|nr:rod shape-determining protein RodA [Phocaeicola sartorii]